MDGGIQDLMRLSKQQIAHLGKVDLSALNRRALWLAQARPNQLVREDDDWMIHMALAGRGFGKTRVETETGWWWGYRNPGWRIAVIAPTERDVRDTIFEGESGLLAVTPPELIQNYNRSLGELDLTNGTHFKGFSASEPERLRGPQHHAAMADELAAWEKAQEAWDQLMFGLRLGKNPKVVIATTPKPIDLLRWLVKECQKDPARFVMVKGHTRENAANLAPIFMKNMEKYEGTRLGRQELSAEILDDCPGALWNRSLLDATRLPREALEAVRERCRRIIVALDPGAKKTRDNGTKAAETGIMVQGVDHKGQGYLLEDLSGRMTPTEWALRAIGAYKRFNADRIVAEINSGGEMVEATLRTVDPNIPFRSVQASKGKIARAEPVSALYEKLRIHHVGVFPDLEDQMVTFDPLTATQSPDRLDAMVWGFTDLIIDSPAEQPVLGGLPEIDNHMPWMANSPMIELTSIIMSERMRLS